jgi:pimeloyl-ACP methyl ester carboxylesterase
LNGSRHLSLFTVGLAEYQKEMKFALLAASLLLALIPDSLSATLKQYEPEPGISLRYTVETPVSLRRQFPVWVYQEGDGNVLHAYSPWRASLLSKIIANTYGVKVIWPELRREAFSSDLKRYCELDFFHRVHDTNRLIDEVRKLPGVDVERIFLIGFSAGSEIAALTAAGRKDIAGVVTVGGGVLSLGDYLREAGGLDGLEPSKKNACREGDYEKRSGIFWKQLLDSGYTEVLRNASIPTLILVGSKDTITRCDITRRFAERLSKVDFQCLSGIGHGLSWLKAWQWKPVDEFTKGMPRGQARTSSQ